MANDRIESPAERRRKFRVVEGGPAPATTKPLSPWAALALGSLWARRPERRAQVRAVANLCQSRMIFDDLIGLIAALGLVDIAALEKEIGVRRVHLTGQFATMFIGGVNVVMTESPNARRIWKPHWKTVALLKAAGYLGDD